VQFFFAYIEFCQSSSTSLETLAKTGHFEMFTISVIGTPELGLLKQNLFIGRNQRGSHHQNVPRGIGGCWPR